MRPQTSVRSTDTGKHPLRTWLALRLLHLAFWGLEADVRKQNKVNKERRNEKESSMGMATPTGRGVEIHRGNGHKPSP